MFFTLALCAAYSFSAWVIAEGVALERKVSLSVHTAYGNFEVTEPVLIDLFTSSTMERLKGIRQYGTQDYVRTDYISNYSRYEHSVGVWALLRHYGALLEEQIAGLLHDASHTVFSHVGDYLFGNYQEKDSYQDDIHLKFLKDRGIDEILAPYGITLEAIDHKHAPCYLLEQNLPDMCADRIEYNIKAAVIIGAMQPEEIPILMNDLCFDHALHRWYFKSASWARRFAEVPLFNTLHVWGGPEVYALNMLTAEVLRKSLDCKLLSIDEIHHSTDDLVWEKLYKSDDAVIQNIMKKIKHYKHSFTLTTPENCDHQVCTKFRGFNPWVKTITRFVRLTDIDPEFCAKYHEIKDQVARGWPLTWVK